MKMIRLFVFAILILFVLHISVSPLFAKAPTTPKILFTSARDGNYDIYIMNPDGSEQVNLTQHRAADLDAVWSPSGEQIFSQLTDISRNFGGDWFDPAFALPVSPQPRLLTTTWGKVKRK